MCQHCFTDSLLDLPLDEATIKAETNGWSVRITKVDGSPRIITRDYHQDRLNFWIENNLVNKVWIG